MLSAYAAAGNRSQAPASEPRVFSMDAGALAQLRERVASEKFTHPALAKLRSDAEKAMNTKPLSVTQKEMTPPSGDKHDYLSLARYWWPDPAKPDGLPYIRRDGEVNPEITKVPDHENLNRVLDSSKTLALAYYLFGEERYAAHAAKLLRVWFLDPETRMNPNLQFAQATRGRNTGRGSGLIDSRRLSFAVDTVGLLENSPSWTETDRKGIKQWFSDYLNWLRTSKNGRQESQAPNNHGSYYDTQVVSIALFLGDTRLATTVLNAEKDRISRQIRKDGSQPLELERTRALWYSTFNIAALFQLAKLGENVGVNLWNYRAKDGASLQRALDFLTPYLTKAEKWPYKQIDEVAPDAVAHLYVIAAVKFHEHKYAEIAQQLDPEISSKIDFLIGGVKPSN
jgi:hypothetical protein